MRRAIQIDAFTFFETYLRVKCVVGALIADSLKFNGDIRPLSESRQAAGEFGIQGHSTLLS